MPVSNLYAVTASLRTLLRYNIWRISGIIATVTDLPPERAEELGTSTLNLHLYHAIEDPSKRNEFARDGLGSFPIKESPLALILYYALTAHFTKEDPPDIAGQQRLMGLAMKTLHDFPAIDDSLAMRPPLSLTAEPVFDAAMRGQHNRIEIIPRQLTAEESVNFWSAAQNHTARLTAYYEVRSTLLPADEVDERAVLVSSYGLGISPGGRPRLEGTASEQTVVLPAALGGGSLTTTRSPAEAALGSAAVPSAALVTATGEDLGDGSAETLILSGPGEPIEVDPVANPEWGILISSSRLRFTVRPTVLALRGGVIATVPVPPGLYGLAVARHRTLVMSGGPPRRVTTRSNAVPMAIGAAVIGATTLSGPPRLHIDLAAGVDATALEGEIELAISGEVYQRHPPGDPGPALGGEFQSVSPSRIEAMLTFDPADGQTRAVRLGLAGVDCAPFWIGP